MEQRSLKANILEQLARGNYNKLKDEVLNGFRRHRGSAIKTLEELLQTLEGKSRLKLLEVLVNDGGADLIPLFLTAVRSETNQLYAKSQILLFQSINHPEALSALLSIEKEIPPDIHSTYQRTLGKMLSQFSEQFYMSEFRSGFGNRRRVQFAADMMIHSPHPAFTNFLNEQILINDEGFRFEGLRALSELGDASSLDIMFALLKKLMVAQTRAITLREILLQNNAEPTTSLDRLAGESGLELGQPSQDSRSMAARMRDLVNSLEHILDHFNLSGRTRKTIKSIFTQMASGKKEPPDTIRLTQALDEWDETLDALVFTCVESMGKVAYRTERMDFLDLIRELTPEQDPRLKLLLIHTLKGYRTEVGLQTLLDFLKNLEDELLLEKTLEALSAYKIETVPEGLERLCFEERNGLLRKKSLQLLGQWQIGYDIVDRVVDRPGVAIRVDGIQTIARYRLEPCYEKVATVLNESAPDSVVIAALEALRVQDAQKIQLLVRPYLIPPHTNSVRKAAMETMVQSRAEGALSTMAAAFENLSLDKFEEILEYGISLLAQDDFRNFAEEFNRCRPFWLDVMGLATGPVREMIFGLTEQLPLKDNAELRGWLAGLNKIKDKIPEQQAELKERFTVLIDTMSEEIKQQYIRKEQARKLDELIAGLKTDYYFQKVQSLRSIQQGFTPETFADQMEGVNRLIKALEQVIDQHLNDLEVIVLVLSIAGKMRHPRLNQKLRPFAKHGNLTLRQAAQKTLSQPVNPLFSRPIRSIMVMDDSRYITKQLSKILKSEHFEVETENDVTEGLAQMMKHKFDLLILDFYMPKMNGHEFLMELQRKQQRPEHTLVITSGRAKEELRPLVSMGIDGLLLKPFRMEEMLQRIKELSAQS